MSLTTSIPSSNTHTARNGNSSLLLGNDNWIQPYNNTTYAAATSYMANSIN